MDYHYIGYTTCFRTFVSLFQDVFSVDIQRMTSVPNFVSGMQKNCFECTNETLQHSFKNYRHFR